MSRAKPSVAHGRIPAFQDVGGGGVPGRALRRRLPEGGGTGEGAGRRAPLRAARVRLDPRDRAELTRRAEAQGIVPSTIVRTWVKERLQREADAEASSR